MRTDKKDQPSSGSKGAKKTAAKKAAKSPSSKAAADHEALLKEIRENLHIIQTSTIPRRGLRTLHAAQLFKEVFNPGEELLVYADILDLIDKSEDSDFTGQTIIPYIKRQMQLSGMILSDRHTDPGVKIPDEEYMPVQPL